MDKVKDLVRATFSRRPGVLSTNDAEAQLRKAGQDSGLNDEQIGKLLDALRNPAAIHALAGQ